VDTLLRAGPFDAIVATLPPGCAEPCARALVEAARAALAPDGGVVLLVVRRGDLASVADASSAVRAAMPRAALVALGARSVVVGGLGALAVAPGRLEALGALALAPETLAAFATRRVLESP
jgi:hypothetical protein